MSKINKVKILIIILGLTLILISFILPIFMANVGGNGTTGIIGGADAPTYSMLYWRFRLYFLTFIGALLAVLGFVKK